MSATRAPDALGPTTPSPDGRDGPDGAPGDAGPNPMILIAAIAAALPAQTGAKAPARADAPPAERRRYAIAVATTDLKYAGTDSDISAVIVGAGGATRALFLDRPELDDFERGTRFEYTFDGPGLGDLKSIRFRNHNNVGPNAGWHLDSAIVTEVNSGRRWRADFRRWLAEGENMHLAPPDRLVAEAPLTPIEPIRPSTPVGFAPRGVWIGRPAPVPASY